MWKKFFYMVLPCLLISCMLSGFPLTVRAASGDFSDTYYYGSAFNSYRQFNSSGCIVYTYPQGTLCFKMNLFDVQYICIACRTDMLVNNGSNVWGLYRSIANYDSSGNLVSGTPSSFFQMQGYSSDNFVTVDGCEYLIRTMEIPTLIDSCPYFFAWSNRSEGARLALEGYISGIKSFESGGTINADVAIDTSNIENLLSDSNQYNKSISNDTVSIRETLESGIITDSAFTVETNEKIFEIRYLLGCLFIVTCGFGFRNILKSWRRNTVK